MDLAGKQVLLTGASGGIGHALAREFHRAGAHLVLHGRREALLRDLADECGAAEVAVGDLADRRHLDELMDATADVDIVVANAGLGGKGRVPDLDAAAIDAVLDVNLRAPIQMGRFYGARMAARGSGHIAFVSSLAAKVTSASTELYSATKAGLRIFAFGLRDSLAGTGVGVSVVLPGFVSEAGMFVEGGGTVPAFVGMVTPAQVAADTRAGIEANRVEVISSTLPARLGSQAAVVAPRVASFLATHTPLGGLARD